MRRTTRVVTVLLAACLISASCGARFDAKQKAALRADATGSRSAGDLTTGDQSAAAGDDTTGGSDAATADATGAGTAGGAGPSGATGAGTAGGPSSAGCTSAGGASDVGVTADSVTVGNVSIMSGPVQGFGRTSQAAVQAYANYINSKGGVCGRKLKVVNADDRLDSGANRAEHEKLKSKVFGFVGGLSVVDDGGAQVLQGTNIPDVGLSLSDARIKLANNFSTSPIDLADGGNGSIPALNYYKSQLGAKVGAVVWPGQAIARARAQGYIRDMQRVGIQVPVQIEVSVTETNYNGVAAKIKENKADVLLTTLELSGMASLAKALKQQEFLPKIAAYGAQAYGQQFLDRAGAAAEGVTLHLFYDIFENKAANPAVANFLKWFGQAAPGLVPDFFAILAWTATEMFIDAFKAAGAKPTRDAVVGELKKVTRFEASGMLAPINPAGKKWASCFLIVKVENQKWKRVEPAASGFRC